MGDYYLWLFSKICGWMVAPQGFQADDRALSAVAVGTEVGAASS